MPKRNRHTFEWSIIHAINRQELFDFSDFDFEEKKDFDGWYPIHWAAASKNFNALRSMLSSGHVSLDTEAPRPNTPYDRTPRIILSTSSTGLKILEKLIQEFEGN